jgi:hypothetical protein
MFIFKNHALRTGVVLAAVLGITFTACKKDDDKTTPPTPRSKSFDVTGTDAKKLGAITVTENTDSSVNVVLNLLKGTVKDTVHNIYFIGGKTSAPTTDTLLLLESKGTGAAMDINLFSKVKKISLKRAGGVTKDTTFKYEDAINYSAYLKVLHSKSKADTIAIGNFGKSI